MNFRYLLPRILRHFLPESIARFLLKRRWIIRPGLESSDPFAAVDQYIAALNDYGKSITGKRVLVFGYGGQFAVGVELLNRGASHVVLCDHFMALDHERNLQLLTKYANYLHLDNGNVTPFSEYITLLHGDIRDIAVQEKISTVDIVLSISVYEHLNDVNGITQSLAKLTSSDGVHLHFVDLRDHYFKYPFEMLTFSESVWKNFLNPTSNLNRFRLPDYRKIFYFYFNKVEVVIGQRNEVEFNRARPRILSEFLTNDVDVDSVELIYLIAESPKI